MPSQFTPLTKHRVATKQNNHSRTSGTENFSDSIEFTPMIQQYLKIKGKIPDTILFFRLGDFYEMFFEDAKLASQILNITLTSREAGKNRKVPMCGIPYHAASTYIKRLVRMGKKIAICEQVEDPKFAKGIVKREITRIITPGTWIEDEFDEAERNYLLSLNKVNTTFGIAWVELSTGEFKVTQIEGVERLILELNRLNPSEFLIPESLKDILFKEKRIKKLLTKVITPYFDWTFEYNTAYSKLLSHFHTSTLQGFGCDDMKVAIGCAGAILRYLEETQKVELSHIKKLVTYSISDFMIIDETTQNNLELVRSLDKDKKNSLFGILDMTSTAMGKRKLIDWILHPLLDIEKINQRLEAVEVLVKRLDVRDRLIDILKDIRDIEKIVAKMSLGWSSARDLIALSNSLHKIPLIKNTLKDVTSPFLSDIKNKLQLCEEVVQLIDSSITDAPPLSIREGGIIKKGFNKKLDELRNIVTGGKNWIAELQKKEIKRTGIQSLKIKFNKVFGYYIEVTKPNLKYIPEDYIRKQTLVNAERFITPELKEYEAKVLGAEEEIVKLEYEIFCDIQRKALKYVSFIQKDAQLISTLDILVCLACLAVKNRWIKPEIDNSDLIDIKNSRHPVLEKNMPSNEFVPNDCLLDSEDNRLLLITGPNMAGKSTYLRQIALIVLMAQIGSFIPASEARIGIVDRIFTRVGAQDKITKGISTFMLEMLETANILNNATRKSLIILDEIGRGTSTFDGVSIAWGCAEYIHNNLKGARTLFATHYHELTQALSDFKGVKNYYLQVKEWQDDIIFLYKLVPGSCDKSFGVHVARLAGIPKEVVKRAREILSSLEINNLAFSKKITGKIDNTKNKEYQLDLFSQISNPIVDELKKLDLDNLTPIEALNKLNQWKKKLK